MVGRLSPVSGTIRIRNRGWGWELELDRAEPEMSHGENTPKGAGSPLYMLLVVGSLGRPILERVFWWWMLLAAMAVNEAWSSMADGRTSLPSASIIRIRIRGSGGEVRYCTCHNSHVPSLAVAALEQCRSCFTVSIFRSSLSTFTESLSGKKTLKKYHLFLLFYHEYPYYHECLRSLQMVFRGPSDQGTVRTKITPPVHILWKQVCSFQDTWHDVAYNGKLVLPPAAIQEFPNILVHIDRGCLSGILPGRGTNRNERLHKDM